MAATPAMAMLQLLLGLTGAGVRCTGVRHESDIWIILS